MDVNRLLANKSSCITRVERKRNLYLKEACVLTKTRRKLLLFVRVNSVTNNI